MYKGQIRKFARLAANTGVDERRDIRQQTPDGIRSGKRSGCFAELLLCLCINLRERSGQKLQVP